MNKLTVREVQDHLQMTLPTVASFLKNSGTVLFTILGSDGTIRFANQALLDLINIDRSEITGKSILCYLTEPDSASISNSMSAGVSSPGKVMLLNWVGNDQVPHSLNCRLDSLADGFLLLGEPPRENNQALQEELLQLNNQLSVLSRENIRKGRALSKALDDLKKTQAMLVHQEKMASLGQMTAGIAHEINNPLAFVLGNEQVLKRDFDDLLVFINTLGDLLPEIAELSPAIHAGIVARAEEVGLEYLAEAVPRKLEANIEGLERVKKIVLDLRNFSRLDEGERKDCVLTEGIESTLRFLGPLQQEYGVTVQTNFSELPPLLCSPGPLNQAISNVLANAIQASPRDTVVRVTTRQEGDWTVVVVEDQGAGISSEHLSKVFDPFFTTKPVGSGTGLGLSIAHQVVDAHAGRIEIDSQLGAGTTVRLLLPSHRPLDEKHSRKETTHGPQ